MATSSTCCGCHLADDYGTSIVVGDGSAELPYSVDQIDPLFDRPVVRTGHQTETTIPHNTVTPIPWTGVMFDSHHMFSMSDPTRLTVVVDGFYLMSFHLGWAISAGAFFKEVRFRLNGTTALDTQTQVYSTLDEMRFSGSYLWPLEVDDYIEIVAFQTSGGNQTIIESSSSFSGFGASMMYLGKRA